MQNLTIPTHIGIILDGNRRWARKRGLPPWIGHRHGAKKFEKFLNWCLELGIKKVSVYVLSTENFKKRSKREIDEILKILREFLERWVKKESVLEKYKVRVRFVGDLDKLPPSLLKLMGKIMQKTAKFNERVVNILVNYGGHFEIKEAVKKIVEKAIRVGKIEITERDIEENLLVKDPVDLIIRTGGYYRLSNFLVWQSSYAEIYVTKSLWPDFTKKELIKAIKWYSSVKRNFGK